MHNQTMNLHHAVTIFVMILALTALIIASIAISGDIDYKEKTIPASAIKNPSDFYDGNPGSNAVVEGALGAVTSGKTQGGDHLHIDGEVINCSSKDLNILHGSSELGKNNADYTDAAFGVPLEGIRFTDVSRKHITTENSFNYIDLKAQSSLDTNYTLELPTAAPAANKVLQVTDASGAPTYKLGWVDNGTNQGVLKTDGSVSIKVQDDAAYNMTIENTDGTSNSAIKIDAKQGGVDIDAAKSITITSVEDEPDSIVIQSTNGGIDITASGADAGDDIDITSSTSVNITGSESSVTNAIRLNAPNGGIDIDAGTGGSGGITIDADGNGAISIGSDTDTGAINIGNGASARTITIGSSSSTAANVTATAITLTSSNALTLTDGTATLLLGGTGATSLAAATTVNLDCTGAMSLNSSGGVINIGDNNVNQNINIGTAGVRAITIGSSSATTFDLDCSGAMSLNSSAGVINIGDDSVNQNINIGTAGERAITIGNTTGTTGLVFKCGTGDMKFNGSSEIVFNDDQVDCDFRIEGDNRPYLFLVDSSEDNIGINEEFPKTKLHITESTGTVYTPDSNTLLLLQHNNAAGSNVGMSILSGTSGESRINFGDENDEDAGQIRYDNGADEMTVKVNTNDVVKFNSNGIEAGDRVETTQTTSKTSDVASSGSPVSSNSGIITMAADALADDAKVNFTFYNDKITANSVIIVNVSSVGSSGAYLVNANTIQTGQCVITVKNISGGSLSEAIKISYFIMYIGSS